MCNNLPISGTEYVLQDGDTLISTSDTAGRIIYANRRFVEVSGYSEDELTGQPHNIMRHPDMPSATFADLWQTIESGRQWSGLIKNRRMNDDFYWGAANVVPIEENGRTVDYMSVRTRQERSRVAEAGELYAKTSRGAAVALRIEPQQHTYAESAMTTTIFPGMEKMNGHSLAAVVLEFGGIGELAVRPFLRPRPQRGEIEVMVEAASINPIDLRRRSGYGKRAMSLLGAATLPLVLGNDFAGTVSAIGPGVTGLREGDRVFGAKPPSSRGTHATHAIVRAEHAVLQPGGVAAAVLATLPYNFLTVTRALSDAGLAEDSAFERKVLVYGASGGLGVLAVWLLGCWGAHVTAIGSGAGLNACREAGAAVVIDRRAHRLADLPSGFAATLNFACWADEASLLRLLAPDALGHATTVHPLLGNFDSFGLLAGWVRTMGQKRRMHDLAGTRYAWTVFRPDRLVLQALADCAAAIPAPALSSFSLLEAADAHCYVEQRRAGRAVLVPGCGL